MHDLIDRTLGHYRIVEKIGAGGMGEVYRAHDERLDRDVAIKVLHEAVAQDVDRLARFEREAKAVAKQDHPNILAIHDFGTDEGVTYAVTELLDGQNLRQSIPASGMPWQKVVEIGAAIADGLAAAHSKGIVHRDLKPENVFITSDGRIKVLDFGLAQVKEPVEEDAETATMTPAGTVAGTVMGTMGYMSPEQLRGEPSDARSDIFALGCVLYEMFLGKTAFIRNSTAETTAAILKEEPPSLSDSGTTLPAELERTIRRCLEKNPEERFQSARDLAFDLRSIATQTGAVGAPQTPAVGVRRWRWSALGGLAIAIAAVAIWQLAPRVDAPEPTEEISRIVVLPFENLGSPDDDYFASGITEEITSRLAAVSGLQVISRTSARRYADTDKSILEIGEELQVGYVLEGTIRWDRGSTGFGRVRITPQLIRVVDDSQLWSERYDRVLEDIFSVQSDIAEQVIDRLEATLLEPERRAVEARPTENIEAYHWYLVGIQYWWMSEEEKYVRAMVDALQRAVELDPEFALAHSALCEAHSMLYHYRYDFTPERLERARVSVERALDLQPGLPEAHRALGWYHYWGFRDYEKALKEFAITAEGLPNDAILQTGVFAIYRRQGRWDKALEALESVRRVDPQGYFTALEAQITFRLLREYEKSEQEGRRAIAIAPSLPDAYYQGALNYVLWDGATDRARRLLESAPNVGSQFIDYYRLLLAYYDRKPELVLTRLEERWVEAISLQHVYSPRELVESICLNMMREERRAQVACASAVGHLEREIEEKPHDHRLYAAIGHALAILGRKEEAVRAGEHAAELRPISGDPLEGAEVATELAQIYTRVGETDKALDLIDELLSIPCDLSVGLLRLDPVWDPLRDNPRFQALLEKYEVN